MRGEGQSDRERKIEREMAREGEPEIHQFSQACAKLKLVVGRFDIRTRFRCK